MVRPAPSKISCFIPKLTGILAMILTVTAISGVKNGYATGVTAKENLQLLIRTGNCPKCDLAGVNLNRMDLSGADLRGADLSGASCFLTNFSGANLRGAILRGTIFGGADLGDADLRGADLRGADLETAYLGGAILEGEMVETTPYRELGMEDVKKTTYVSDKTSPKQSGRPGDITIGERKVLTDPPPQLPQVKRLQNTSDGRSRASRLQGSPVVKDAGIETKVGRNAPEVHPVQAPAKKGGIRPPQKADTGSVKLVRKPNSSESGKNAIPASYAPGAAATTPHELVSASKKAELDRLQATGKCYGCDLSNLHLGGMDLEGADLEKANLSGCNLQKADLEGANLKGADLGGADLRNSDLRRADLYKANLKGALLTGAKLEEAKLDDAILDDGIGFGAR